MATTENVTALFTYIVNGAFQKERNVLFMYLSNLYVMKFFHHIFHFYFKRIVNICLAQINCGAVIRL